MAAPTFAPALGLVDAAGVPISATNPLSVSLIAGGVGTAVSIADGADVALGSLADSSSALTVNGLLKAIKALLGAPLAVTGSFYQATQPVSIAAPIAVTGTFWQATQPVSGTVAVTNSNLDAALSTLATKAQLPTTLGITTKAASLSIAFASDQVGTAGAGSTTVLTVQGNASGTALPVSGTFWQATQPVSIAASVGVTGTFWQATQPISATNLDVALSTLSLKNQFPTTLGITTKAASLSVALASDQVGTAGAGSTTVFTVQGNSSGTAIPVSGTVTALGAATETSLAKLTITQGVALGSNTLVLMGGNVTTSPPTVSTGTLQPLNLNLTGALRVDASNNTVTTTGSGTAGSAAAGVSSVQGVSGMTPVQVSGTVSTGAAPTTPPVYMAGLDSGSNVRPIALDTTGRPAGSSKTFITTNVTTQLIKSGAGVLRGIIINPGVTSAFLLYDSSGAASGQFSGAGTTAPAYLYEIQYGPNGVAFTNGLVITTSGGTPAQLLVIWD